VDGATVDRTEVETESSDGGAPELRPARLGAVGEDVPTAAPAPPGRASWWKELLVIGWLYWLYDAVNNLTAVRERLAFANGSAVLNLERRLHLDPELAFNQWLGRHDLIGLVLSDFYNVVHLDLTLVVICWLWWKTPPNYRTLRNTLVLTNVVGFVVFMLYPVAPPRMLPGYIDTVVDTHAWFSSHSQGNLAKAANQFAAMPSLHVAWAMWVTMAVWTNCRNRVVRALAVAHPLLTLVAIIATANHYLLDAVAGAATFGVCLAAADGWARARRRRATAPLNQFPSGHDELSEESGDPVGAERGRGDDGDRISALA
jgi:hypothetical protein